MKTLENIKPTSKAFSLCNNCLHDGNCTLQKLTSGPIMFCEEHHVVGSKCSPELKEHNGTEFNGHHSKQNRITIPGLCGTCDHVKTCKLRSDHHITLHCEEYQ